MQCCAPTPAFVQYYLEKIFYEMWIKVNARACQVLYPAGILMILLAGNAA